MTGSIRPNSVNEKVVPLVVSQLQEKGANAVVADLKELHLPFFDSPVTTSNPAFAPTDENVQRWTKMVADADGVVFVMPEYNRTMSPVQLNAIDWIGKEWKDKPVALVGYGWTSGARQAQATAREVLAAQLKADVISQQTNLSIPSELAADGSIADENAVNGKISVTLDELLKTMK